MNYDFLEEEFDHAKKFAEFIGKDLKYYKYLHNTEEESIAKQILERGFHFESHLENTTDLISGTDLIELKYFLIKRKRYGNYTIVIEIDKKIVDSLSRQITKTSYHFSEILTNEAPFMGENDEPVYNLPCQFIKGYFNHNSLQGVFNKHFQPDFYPEYFNTNLKNLLSGLNNNLS